MKTLRLTGILVAAAVAGCQWSHRFALEDVDRLVPGTSSREEVERILGPSEDPDRSAHVSSARDLVVPPFPLSVVLFPVFFHAHGRRFEFTPEFTPEGILRAGTLEIFEESRTRVLLIFGGNDFRVTLAEGELEVLRRLERKGLAVRIFVSPVLCFGGVIGGESVSLDEYLQHRSPD